MFRISIAIGAIVGVLVLSILLLCVSSVYAGDTKLGMGGAGDQHNVLGDLSVSDTLTASNINRVVVIDGSKYARTDVGINAAIASLPSSGGEVFMPEGTYTIAAAITISKSYVTLRGSGAATHLDATGNAVNVIEVSASNALIKDLRITGGTLDGIDLNGADSCRIQGVSITGCGDDGIVIRGDSDNNSIIGNTITGNTGHGIDTAAGCDTNIVEGNYLAANTAGYFNDAGDTVIINNADGDDVRIESLAGEHIFLMPGANVGIGTTSPEVLLDIAGNTSIGGNLSVTSNIEWFGSDNPDNDEIGLLSGDDGVTKISALWNSLQFEVMRTTDDFNWVQTNGPNTLMTLLGTGLLGVVGDASISGSLTVGNPVDISSEFIGAGDMYVENDVEIGDRLSVGGNVTINGNLEVNGLTFPDGGLVFSGDIDMDDNDILDVDQITGGDADSTQPYLDFNLGDSDLAIMAGNVGISTTDPKAALDVSGNTSISGNVSVGDTLFVDDAIGNVGIGTATPIGALNLIPKGNINPGPNFLNAGLVIGTDSVGIALDANQIESAGGEFYINYSGTQHVMLAGGGGNVGIGIATGVPVDEAPDARLEVSAVGGASDLFMLSSNDTTDGDLFVVKNSGNVGIGTTVPGRLLGVAGDATINGYLSVGGNLSVGDTLFVDDATTGNVGIGTASPTAFMLQVDGNVGPHVDDTYDLGSDTLRWKKLYIEDDTIHIGTAVGDEGIVGYDTVSNDLSLSSVGDIVMQSDSGNVGIGTTAPNRLLGVAGDTTINGYLSIGGNLSVGDTLYVDDVTTGNVGIGTATPADKLVVTGDIRAQTSYFVPQVLVFDTSTTSVTGAGFNTINSFTLPGGILGTDNGIRITLWVRITSGSDKVWWRLIYGGTTICTTTQDEKVHPASVTEIMLFATGATNSQRGYLHAGKGPDKATGTGTSAVDSTADQTVTIQLDLNTDGDSFASDCIIVEIIKPTN